MNDEAAARFVDVFARFWARPDPEALRDILTADVELIQPLSAKLVGIEAAVGEFDRLVEWLPDLRGEVDRWAAREGDLFIEFDLLATIGGRRARVRAIDRFTLVGERARVRVSTFDPVPIALLVLSSPREVVRWLRSGAARRLSGPGPVGS
jgi:hypothetical protein